MPLIQTVPESIFRWPDDSKTLLLRASLLNTISRHKRKLFSLDQC